MINNPGKHLSTAQRWLIVLGGFICYFLADGYTFSIGVMYSYFLTAFGLSGSTTAVLPGLLYAVPQFSGMILCPLLDTYGYSSGAAWGAILLSSSCFGKLFIDLLIVRYIASAFVNSIDMLYITLGLVASIGLQLVYSSAIMAVTEVFKDDKFFGLAVGVTMCGSGLGSSASNPLVAQMLDWWTWREVLVIEAAILLHSMISASCFHHLDAVRFGLKSSSEEKTIVVVAHTPMTVKSKEMLNLAGNTYPSEFDDVPTSGVIVAVSQASHRISPEDVQTCRDISFRQPHLTSMQRLWCALRFTLCMPSRYRFDSKYQRSLVTNHTDDDIEGGDVDGGCQECGSALWNSLKQLCSPKLWTNSTFLIYILANGLAGMGVVIPWTFIYDHAVVSLSVDGNLDDVQRSAIAWLPSLIGFGSLAGQIMFGLFSSQFTRLKACCRGVLCCSKHEDTETTSSRRSTSPHLYLFIAVLLWNGLTTFLLALLPLSNLVSVASTQSMPEAVSLFHHPLGQAVGAACFLVGISYGGIYVLYPQILMDTVGEELWAAALGLFLFLNGAMNLIGTNVGGRIFDATGSYKSAFILAAIIPFVGVVLILMELSIKRIKCQR